MSKKPTQKNKESWLSIMIKRVLLPISALLLLTVAVLQADKGPLDLIDEPITDVHGQQVSLDSLEGKYVGIYFSAHWCPPCRLFTPKLVAFRNAHQDQLEIIFVSSDRSADAQKTYMEETGMQWPSVPWRGKSATALKNHFQVSSIPTLVILNPDGKVVSVDGRSDVMTLGDNAFKSWQKASGKN